jgi:hypothetical protein
MTGRIQLSNSATTVIASEAKQSIATPPQVISVTGKRFLGSSRINGFWRSGPLQIITRCNNSVIRLFDRSAPNPDRGLSSLFTAL